MIYSIMVKLFRGIMESKIQAWAEKVERERMNKLGSIDIIAPLITLSPFECPYLE